LLDLPWLHTLYLGRLTALLAWLACVFWALRLMPAAKWLLCLLALTPMSLFQAASLSPDSFTLGVTFLFTGLVLRAALTPGAPGVDRLPVFLGMSLLAVLIALTKQAYFPLVALFLLIPSRAFSSPARYLLVFVTLVVLTVVSMVSWSILNREAFEASLALIARVAEPARISAPEQLQLILSAPWFYTQALWNTWYHHGGKILAGFVGSFGWQDTPLPLWLTVCHGGMLLALTVFDEGPIVPISQIQRALLLAVGLGTTLVIMTSAYLIWTPVGGLEINIQGRYFIPLAILILLPLHRRRVLSHRIFSCLLPSYLFVALTTMLVVLLQRYYL
jgi:uncharacterized membrane protein